MSKVQTDNSYFGDKVIIRLKNLPNKKELKILDCFAGDGKIWNKIKKITNKKLYITGIDIKRNKKGIILVGDNLKFLESLDLKKYDIIDLDSYGIPFKQLEIIFKRQYKGLIFGTFVQSIYGGLPHKMLNILGYTNKMIRKIPSLFYRDGFDKFKHYLSCRGVKKINYRNSGRKYYFCFKIEGGF